MSRAEESNEDLRAALRWLASLALNLDDVPCPPHVENCEGYWGAGHGTCVDCLVDWALAEARKEGRES